MIETTILEYLEEYLDVECYMEMPRTMPTSAFVIIERTGRFVTDCIVTSMFAFQSYAPTLAEAAALNERVESAVATLPTLPAISAAHFNSSYNYTDTETKQYRYQCVFDITHY